MSDPNNDPNNGNAPNEEENRKAPKSWLDPNIDPQKLREDIINKAREIQEIAASEELLDDPEVDKHMAMNGLGKQWIHDKELIRKGIELAEKAAKMPPPKNPEDEKTQLRNITENYLLMVINGMSEKEKKEYLSQVICGAESLLGRVVDKSTVRSLKRKSVDELKNEAMELSRQVMDERVIPAMNNDYVSPFEQELTPFPVNDSEAIAASMYIRLKPYEIPPIITGMVSQLGKANKAAVEPNTLFSILEAIFVGLVVLSLIAICVGALAGVNFIPLIIAIMKIICCIVGVGTLFTMPILNSRKARRQEKIAVQKQEIEKLLSAPRVPAWDGWNVQEPDVKVTDPKP